MSTQPIVVDPSLVQSISVDPSEVSAMDATSSSARPDFAANPPGVHAPTLAMHEHDLFGPINESSISSRIGARIAGNIRQPIEAVINAANPNYKATPEDKQKSAQLKQQLYPDGMNRSVAAVTAGPRTLYGTGKALVQDYTRDPANLVGDVATAVIMGGADAELPADRPPTAAPSLKTPLDVRSVVSGPIGKLTTRALTRLAAKKIPGYHAIADAVQFARDMGWTEERGAQKTTQISPPEAVPMTEGTPWGKPILQQKQPFTPSEAEPFEGVTSPQAEQAAAIEPEAPVAETQVAASETQPTLAEILNKKGTPAELEKLLSDALGGKPFQPLPRGTAIAKRPIAKTVEAAAPVEPEAAAPEAPAPATQNAAAARIEQALKNADQTLQEQATAKAEKAAVPLPAGFTPVESSVVRGYKYDPATREFESLTNAGQHYIHGDVGPEVVETFEKADSKGKAWNALRQSPGVVQVAKVIDGKRMPTVTAAMRSATGETISMKQAGMEVDPALAAKAANLQDFMRSSPAKAMKTSAKAAGKTRPKKGTQN